MDGTGDSSGARPRDRLSLSPRARWAREVLRASRRGFRFPVPVAAAPSRGRQGRHQGSGRANGIPTLTKAPRRRSLGGRARTVRARVSRPDGLAAGKRGHVAMDADEDEKHRRGGRTGRGDRGILEGKRLSLSRGRRRHRGRMASPRTKESRLEATTGPKPRQGRLHPARAGRPERGRGWTRSCSRPRGARRCRDPVFGRALRPAMMTGEASPQPDQDNGR